MLSRRQLLLSAAGGRLIAQQRAERAAPNIVLIAAENLSAWMCGCYGNRDIRTPNIDLLARMGTRFLHAFTPIPATSPGRATLLTGRLPAQHGIEDFLTSQPVADPPQGQAAQPPWFAEEVMVSDVLSAEGYNCGFAGAWGIGNDRNPGHGFRYTCTVMEEEFAYSNPRLANNGEVSRHEGYLPELVTGAASEFLDRQSADKPFCLVISYPLSADPYEGHPSPYSDMYAGAKFENIGWLPKADNALRGAGYLDNTVESLRNFVPGITAIDAQLKVLHEKLRAMKLWTDTLVVFTSVNGHLAGRHGLWGSGLASDPPNMFDDVVQVPLILSWPGKIPVEGVRPEMVGLYDLLPTLCDLANTTPPAGRNLPGRSFGRQALGEPAGKDAEPWPDNVYGEYHRTRMARDNRFKVITRNGGEGPNEFYRLRSDPRELRNRYDDPSIVTVRDRLAAQADEWLGRYVK